MSGGSGEGGYWPGFVDALTNVVIAMVFVVVTLAISLTAAVQKMGAKAIQAQMELQQERQKAAREAPPQDQPKPAPTPAVGAPPPAPESRLEQQVKIPVLANEGAASAPSSQVKAARNRLELAYAKGAMALDSSAQDKLTAALKAMPGGLGNGRLSLVAVGPDMGLTDNQRAAYVRMMSVRNHLLDLGWKPESIALRIDTQSDPAEAAIYVVLEP